MDIEIDKPGDPHWLSKPVCSCVLDRHAFRTYSRLQTLNYQHEQDRSLPTYTPIAKLCPLHASAPELLKALQWALSNVRMPYGVDAEEFAGQYNNATALVQRVRA